MSIGSCRNPYSVLGWAVKNSRHSLCLWLVGLVRCQCLTTDQLLLPFVGLAYPSRILHTPRSTDICKPTSSWLDVGSWDRTNLVQLGPTSSTAGSPSAFVLGLALSCSRPPSSEQRPWVAGLAQVRPMPQLHLDQSTMLDGRPAPFEHDL